MLPFIVTTIIAFVATIIAIQQYKHAAKQTKIAEQLRAREIEREREETEWLRAHEAIANQLVKINHFFSVKAEHDSAVCLYPWIFPEQKFRSAIETYIIEVVQSGRQFMIRKPTALDLRSDNFRNTVSEATRQLAVFAVQYPEIYKRIFRS